MNSCRTFLTKQVLPTFSKSYKKTITTTSSKLQQTETSAATQVTDSPKPLTYLTEDEQMMKETVRRLAVDQIGPHVRDMDRDGFIKQPIIDMLFENGVSCFNVLTPCFYYAVPTQISITRVWIITLRIIL
ncbi:short/branched chain specific acyl-CoA dehydrogenase, mitochondrial-like [Photinus pyralis]|uniref:short/branched chain specific acyl-CoA dehydrogenase, mitochondrial-like n=1 Tax=Photinus pyralis TaxID=7054 RepID=UPI0012674A7B|nr:short/branched chain specific acyl-CoA dehydrogenase, mitochondrial-like [Photinus pyralis]